MAQTTVSWGQLLSDFGVDASKIPVDPKAMFSRREQSRTAEADFDAEPIFVEGLGRPTDVVFTRQCQMILDCDDPPFGPPRDTHISTLGDTSCVPPIPPLALYRSHVAQHACVSGEYCIPLQCLPPNWRVAGWTRSLAIEKKSTSKRIPGMLPEFSIQYKVVNDEWLVIPRFSGFRLFGPPRHDCRILGETIPEERRACAWEMHDSRYVVNQKDIVKTALRQMTEDCGTGVPYGGAILVEPCSSGKTTQCQKIISCLGVVAVIVTHTSLLVDQHLKSMRQGLPHIKAVRFDTKDQTPCFDADVIVATVQSILMLGDELSTRVDDAVRRRVGLLIVDEAHRFAAEQFRKVTSIFRATFRLAMTATPNRLDGLGVILPMYFGRVAYALAPIPVPHARVVWLRYKTGDRDMMFKDRGGDMDYLAMVQRLAADGRRCAHVCRHLQKIRGIVSDKGEGVVAMVRMEDMLLRLFEDFRKGSSAARGERMPEIIYGKHSASKGKRWKEALEKARGADALFTTFKFFQEGSDFGHLSAMMCADYTTNMEQTFGRITRGLGRLKVAELERLRATGQPLPGMSRPVAVFVVDPCPVFNRSVKVCKDFFHMVEAQQMDFDLESDDVPWEDIFRSS